MFKPKRDHWPEYLFMFLVMLCPMAAASWLAGNSILSMVTYFFGTMIFGLVLWVGVLWLAVRDWRS
jgi:hypothetical protein